MNSRRLPYVLMRGGTSKGVFLHSRDVPERGAELDSLLLGVMGSPDPMQIDGLGGTYSSTSKAVVVEVRAGVVHYRFAQVGVADPVVDWSGNCGNLTTAVAPFAIDEGLIGAPAGMVRVPLHNDNTGVSIEAEVESDGERAVVAGSLAIAGVPGTGAPITTRYIDPSPHGVLPTGVPVDALPVSSGAVDGSIVAVTHPYVFIDMAVLGDRTTPDAVNWDAALLARVEELRSTAAAAMRAARFGDLDVQGPAWPRIVAVGHPVSGGDIRALAFSMGSAHRALPMTAALCLAAATRIDGTLPNAIATDQQDLVRIEHPKGVAEVEVRMRGLGDIASVGVVRTARRIADGTVYIERP